MKKATLLLSFIICVAGISSCYNDKYDKLYPADPTNTCDTTNIKFAADIMPILTANCNMSACHDAATAFNFTGYAGIETWAKNGRLVGDINHVSGYNPMPKNLPKISQCEIDKITRWVNLGALNN